MNSVLSVPAGWQWTTLGELAEYINGRAFKPTDWKDFGRPIIRIQNLTGSSRTLNRYPGEVEEKYIIKNGDLLISWSATLGAFIYQGEEAVLNQHIFKVVPKINQRFLYYLVINYLDSLKTQVHGSGMQHITKGKFDSTKVLLPPPEDQEKIVNTIEELFTQLDAAEAALKRAKINLKRYQQSLLQAAVTGELTREWREEHQDEIESANKLLERIKAERRSKWEAEMKAKGKNPTKEKYKEPSPPDTSNLPELPDGWCWVRISLIADHRLGKMLDKDKNLGQLLPYLRNANVQWFDFDLSDLKSIKIKKEELENVSIEKGDLIICEGGEPGRSAVWYHDYPIVIQKALHRVRFPERILPEYVNYHLANDAKTGLLERHFTGSTIKHFTGESLSKYILALPPFDEQLKILELVENNYSKVQQLIQLCNNTLIKIQNTRKSILKKLFWDFSNIPICD